MKTETRSSALRAGGATRRARAQGFTLIEIIVVLAIVGLIMGLGVNALRSLARSDLRGAATHLSGAMRFLFDRASTTGKTHRLVLDLEGGRYWAEITDDKFYVPREVESPEETRRREELEAKEDEERLAAEAKAAAATSGSSSSSSSSSGLPMDSSFDVSKLDVGEFRPKRARFAAFKELALKPVTLSKRVVFRSVYTPRSTEPVTSGRAYIYFFPLGQTEAAIVSLSDPGGETVYSLVAHPITGRVRVYNQEVKPPISGPTDDTGKVVAP
ncbi:MAG TPA: type II secretion system protein [Polyangia bacterium]|jgi:general secretion pathway protein H